MTHKTHSHGLSQSEAAWPSTPVPRWTERLVALGHLTPRVLPAAEELRFWDWSLSSDSGDEHFSDPFLTMLGVDAAISSLAKLVVDPTEMFWVSFARVVDQCLNGAPLINVYGRFTNARGREVEVWALGHACFDPAGIANGARVRFCERAVVAPLATSSP